MTLDQWTETIISELRAAGFEARVHEGFPLAKTPTEEKDFKKLIEFETTYPTARRIYAEGVLFTPEGIT